MTGNTDPTASSTGEFEAIAAPQDGSARELPSDLILRSELRRDPHALIFEARQASLDRRVIYKRYLTVGQDTASARCHREVSALAAVQHPHVVRIFDQGETAEGPYSIQEFLSGLSFSTLLVSPTEWNPLFVRRLLFGLARGLQAVHRAGYIHGQMCPENVVLDAADPGHPRLINFTLAARIGERPQTPPGPPAYQAPERADRAPADPKADIFGLGILAYRALTGHLPFEGDDFQEIRHSRNLGEPSPVELFNPQVEPALAHTILSMLHLDPQARPDLPQILHQLQDPSTSETNTVLPTSDGLSDQPTLLP